MEAFWARLGWTHAFVLHALIGLECRLSTLLGLCERQRLLLRLFLWEGQGSAFGGPEVGCGLEIAGWGPVLAF